PFDTRGRQSFHGGWRHQRHEARLSARRYGARVTQGSRRWLSSLRHFNKVQQNSKERAVTVSRKPCGRSWTVVPGIYPEPGAAFETPRAFLGSRFQAGSRGHRARFSRQIGARLSRHFHAASETDWHGFRGSSGRLPRQIGAAFEAVNTAFNAPLHGFRDRSITAFGAPLKSLTNIEYSSPSSSYIHSHRSANPTLNLSLNQRKERIRIASTTARNFDFPPPLRGALPPCRLTPTQARHTPQKER